MQMQFMGEREPGWQEKLKAEKRAHNSRRLFRWLAGMTFAASLVALLLGSALPATILGGLAVALVALAAAPLSPADVYSALLRRG